jgi:ABC-type multidrug transport system fused ATPase/permease subunit
VRNNIIFGLPFDEERYQRCIEVSQLTRDLTLLGAGDATEIGEKGINLSGGQKQRVSIARAVYADADIVLLDDPLSALDAHVAKAVFDKCVCDGLKEQTRVFVTNQLQFVNKCDHIVLLDRGNVLAEGTYDELLKTSDAFQQLIAQVGAEDSDDDAIDDVDDGSAAVKATDVEVSMKGMTDDKQIASTGDGAGDKNETGVVAGLEASVAAAAAKKTAVALVQAEEREMGTVGKRVFSGYIRAMGGPAILIFIICLFIFSEVARVGASWWIGEWSTDSMERSQIFYVLIFATFGVFQAMTALTYNLLTVTAGIRAGKNLHADMFTGLLMAPISFFHQTPLGRIINRFTNDVGQIDQWLAVFVSVFLRGLTQLAGSLIVIGITTPFALATFMPVLCLFFWVQRYFQRTSRELKRLDSISKSPVFANFSQCLQGLSSIHAYRSHERLGNLHSLKVDNNTRIALGAMSSNRWLSLRLEFLGGIMVLATTLFVVFSRGVIAVEAAGLALSYALQITALLNMNVRVSAVAENAFNSVERVQHCKYCTSSRDVISRSLIHVHASLLIHLFTLTTPQTATSSPKRLPSSMTIDRRKTGRPRERCRSKT